MNFISVISFFHPFFTVNRKQCANTDLDILTLLRTRGDPCHLTPEVMLSHSLG